MVPADVKIGGLRHRLTVPSLRFFADCVVVGGGTTSSRIHRNLTRIDPVWLDAGRYWAFPVFGDQAIGELCRRDEFRNLPNVLCVVGVVWRLQEGSVWLHDIALFNPFTHSVELIRFALYLKVNWTSLAVVVLCATAFLTAAIIAYNPSRGLIRRTRRG